MADIVTLDELKAYLGVTPAADDALLDSLLDHVEALFERATLRDVGYYTADDYNRTEVHDGTGSSRLFLDYPIATLRSVTLGYDTTETLDLTSRAAVVFQAGSRRVTRTDGGRFGAVGQSGYVTVVYDHLGNLPEDAKLPIMEVVAALYRNKGTEGMRSETVGSFYSYTKDDAQSVAASNPLWQQAVEANRAVVIA